LSDNGLLHICTHSPLLEEIKLGHYVRHKINITNKGIEYIATNLKKLKVLECQELQVDDKGIEFLQVLAPTLEILVLNRMILNNQGMEYIGKLINLKKLWIGGFESIDIDDNGIKQIESLVKLQDLNISNAKIGDETFKIIGTSFHQLQRLYAQNSKITDNGLNHLVSLKKLQILQLGGIRNNLFFTDEGIKNLKPLSNSLTELDVGGNPLTDISVEILSQFKKLTSLTILNTKITSKGTLELVKQLPGCKIK